MRVLLQDLGYAFRQLRKTPGFTVTVLLTLALGIGANSAIFTLVNAILLHNLPVTDPKTLIRIGDKDDCCVNGGWNDKGTIRSSPPTPTTCSRRTCRSSRSWPRWSPATPGGPLPSAAPDPRR